MPLRLLPTYIALATTTAGVPGLSLLPLAALGVSQGAPQGAGQCGKQCSKLRVSIGPCVLGGQDSVCGQFHPCTTAVGGVPLRACAAALLGIMLTHSHVEVEKGVGKVLCSCTVALQQGSHVPVQCSKELGAQCSSMEVPMQVYSATGGCGGVSVQPSGSLVRPPMPVAPGGL